MKSSARRHHGLATRQRRRTCKSKPPGPKYLVWSGLLPDRDQHGLVVGKPFPNLIHIDPSQQPSPTLSMTAFRPEEMYAGAVLGPAYHPIPSPFFFPFPDKTSGTSGKKIGHASLPGEVFRRGQGTGLLGPCHHVGEEWCKNEDAYVPQGKLTKGLPHQEGNLSPSYRRFV